MSSGRRWRFLLPTAWVLGGCGPQPAPPCGAFDETFAYVDADGDGFGSTERGGWVCGVEAGTIRTLAKELGPQKITVNTVAPGRIATERIEELDRASAERSGKSLEARSSPGTPTKTATGTASPRWRSPRAPPLRRGSGGPGATATTCGRT